MARRTAARRAVWALCGLLAAAHLPAASYYVNDGNTNDDIWCSAAGSDANSGTTSNAPKASLSALLASVALTSNDVVYVDAGHYYLSSNAAVTNGGGPNARLSLRGVPGGTYLDRGSRTNGAFCIEVRASCVTVDGFTCANAEVGIFVNAAACRDAILIGNTCCSNSGPGIRVIAGSATNGSFQIVRNLLYANGSGLALQREAGTGDRFYITNNTVVVTNSAAVSIGGQVADSTLRNNILEAGASGVCLDIAAPSSNALPLADFNCYFAYDGGSLAQLALSGEATNILATLTDWQRCTVARGGLDSHSTCHNPLFASPCSDFHLRAKNGRWFPTGVLQGYWTNDSQQSLCIDAGHPGTPVGAETTPNGGRVNLGAYGGTWQGSRTATDRWMLAMAPDFGQVTGQTQGIFWIASGMGWNFGADTVRLDYSLDAGSTWSNIAPSLGVSSGFYGWQRPADTFSSPSGCTVRVAYTSNIAVNGMALLPTQFAFVSGSYTYYVNDGSTNGDLWCTQPGSDAADGLSPATPLATLPALLTRYTLGAGDVVFVDAGTYALSNNVIVASPHGGTAEQQVKLQGANRATVFNRGAAVAGAYALDVQADHIVVDGFTFTGGDAGVHVASFADADVHLTGNTCHGNARYGILIDAAAGTSGTIEIRHNVLYDNGAGVLLSGSGTGHNCNLQVRNNTIVVTRGAAISVADAINTSGVWNNIIEASGSGTALAGDRATALAGDYNNYFLHDGGAFCSIATASVYQVYRALTDWQALQQISHYDEHSLSRNPLFANPAGGDFHECSRGGRWLMSSAGGGMWVYDTVHSPCIDAANPYSGEVYSVEPQPNGGRLNMGAYGNTVEASKSSPLRMLTLTGFVESNSAAQVVSLAWCANGQGWTANDSVRLEYSPDGGKAWYVLPGAASLPRNITSFYWQMATLSNAAASGLSVHVRVVCNQDSSVRDEIVLGIQALTTAVRYYVNDGFTNGDVYCTAPGSFQNDGLSPATPMDSLWRLLSTRTLGPGDTVFVDTGHYVQASPAVLPAGSGGTPGRYVSIVGSPNGSLLDSSGSGSGEAVLEVEADCAAIRGLLCKGGKIGIAVNASSSLRALLTGNVCFSNSQSGIEIKPWNGGGGLEYMVLQNVCWGNGQGMWLEGPSAVAASRAVFVVENNTLADNAGAALVCRNAGAAGWRTTNLKNNILRATGAGRICLAALSNSLSYSDFNNLDAMAGAGVAAWTDPAGATTAVFAAAAGWQAASGLDTHSLATGSVFAAPASGNYRLAASSPCVDAGVNSFWMKDALDAAGGVRVFGSSVDIGAYEFRRSACLRVFLQGPYVAGNQHGMNRGLSSAGLLPPASPYAADPRFASGTVSGAVDWVLVQLRETPASAPVVSRSLMLRADGWVVTDSGSTNLPLNLPANTNFYVSIHHRNHLPALTATPVSFTNDTFTCDFTVSSARYFGGGQAAVQMSDGAWASAAGDADGDGTIGPADLAIAQSQSQLYGYHRGDCNLDGWIDSASDQYRISANMGRSAGIAKPETILLPMMRLQPSQAARLPGETQVFTAVPATMSNQFVSLVGAGGGNYQTASWTFTTNASGAQLTAQNASNVLYTAGAATGRVDVIEAWNPVSDALGRAVVTVLDTQEVARAGQVIIVAGRKSAADSLWPVTDYLADTAYTTLRDRGFAKSDIHYFSPEPGQDVDGNGLLDDIEGLASRANVALACTNACAGADRLFLYLVDHGGDSSGYGYFRLSADETITATELRSWLDALQDTYHTEVTVLLDFCYSGSFVDELAYAGTARRIVIAACASNEPTYFVAGGLVSFSEAFFSGLLLGYDVKQCFDLAQGAMSAYQESQLDDDRNGQYIPGVDGAASTNYYIGPTGVAPSDAPAIGTVCGNQVLTEETSATLWVADITSLQPIGRVWCQIVPPGFNPDPENPVTSLPEFDLTYDSDSGAYAVTYDAFTAAGTYIVLFYARDASGRVSAPRQCYVSQVGYDDRLILVAGGPTGAAPWEAEQYLVPFADSVFRLRLYDSAHIRCLAPVSPWDLDLDGSNDVSALSSRAALQSAINGWAASNNTDRLTLYLLGAGVTNTFRLNETETLDAATFAGWLDAFQTTNPVQVCVILDFAGAGAFVSALATTNPVTGEAYDRIVIASSQAGADALFNGGGTVSFSQYLLAGILSGETLGDAYTAARRAIRRVSGGVRQRACIDDNGNGVPSEKNVDGAVADTVYLGSAFLTGDDTPVIGAVTPLTVLPDGVSTALLWAADISGNQGISNVWCAITPPDYAGVGELPFVDLSWNAGTSRYEAPGTGFILPGSYILTFYAVDNAGVVSASVQSEILHADAFEPDDSPATASLLYGPAQRHTFHTPTDVDWVRFYLVSNLVYDISTTHFSINLDTVIDLYRAGSDGTLTAIDHVDEEGADEGEYTGLDNPDEGFYYARIGSYAADGTNGTAGSYEFSVEVPAAGSTYTLIVLGLNTITAGALPTNASATVTGQGTKTFNGATSVSFSGLTNGAYTITVPTPTNFFPREDPNTPNQVGSLTNLYYANPRQIQINGGWYMAGFEMIPWLTVGTGVVRDAWTHAFLDQAAISFLATSGSATGYVAQAHVIFTYYGTNWYSQANGRFPTNVILSENNWDMRIGHAGYVTNVVTNAIAGIARGSVLDMGTIYLVPVDTNGNQIADDWEQRYFPGVGASPTNDPDGDGVNTLGEYMAGTNPTNAVDALRVTNITVSAAGIVSLSWNVVASRGYRVDASTSLVGSAWSPTGGVWEASYGISGMSWTSAPTAGPCYYRVAVTNL